MSGLIDALFEEKRDAHRNDLNYRAKFDKKLRRVVDEGGPEPTSDQPEQSGPARRMWNFTRQRWSVTMAWRYSSQSGCSPRNVR